MALILNLIGAQLMGVIMSKTSEQKLLDRLFAAGKRDIHKVINNKADLEAIRCWHKYAKDSNRKEAEWLNRQGKETELSITGILCLLFGLWGKRGYQFGRALDTLKSGLEEGEPTAVVAALRRQDDDDKPAVQPHGVI